MRAYITHANITVFDLDRSIAFYEQALSLKVQRRKDGDGYSIAFLADQAGDVQLELTWFRDHAPYELGDNEVHIGFVVDDFDAAHALHTQMGCICYENKAMGIYFIEDPDGYWQEILPPRR